METQYKLALKSEMMVTQIRAMDVQQTVPQSIQDGCEHLQLTQALIRALNEQLGTTKIVPQTQLNE